MAVVRAGTLASLRWPVTAIRSSRGIQPSSVTGRPPSGCGPAAKSLGRPRHLLMPDR